MNFFGIGLPEMAVIAAVGLLVFGPKRLPELGRTLGRTLKGFQSASSEFEKEFRTAISTAEATTAQSTTADATIPELPSGETASVPAALPAVTVSSGEPTGASPDTSAD